jgi:ubiquinone/menaquinone biosynthesis C-methylase UbiE
MWSWLKHPSIDPLSVSMVGVKLADRLLVIGCGDAKLIAALAVKAGLTGRACAVDESEERVAAAARTVMREGALVETIATPYTMLPFDQSSFDIVVFRDVLGTVDPDRWVRAVGEARRVLRPGGRCLTIDTVAAGGLASLINRARARSEYGTPRDPLEALRIQDFVGVRILAERDGLVFVEAVKANR